MKISIPPIFIVSGLLFFLSSCKINPVILSINTVTGKIFPDTTQTWLSHEHIMVDFIGADSIRPDRWRRVEVIRNMRPFLEELKQYNVGYFVDATPAYLGRDIALLDSLCRLTGIQILTNTGFYGARKNIFVPSFVKGLTAEELAAIWIDEFENGIDNTGIKPGFIKIGIDNTEKLDTIQQKLVKAAAITHLATGMVIASHTGKAVGLWPQLKILRENGVSPDNFIWVHAQNETDTLEYLKAAAAGCWISLDGMGWETGKHIEKLLFARRNGFLEKVLVSHDAGWYDPGKEEQRITPFTQIFTKVIPELREKGFTREEMDLLLKRNPARAFSLKTHLHSGNDQL